MSIIDAQGTYWNYTGKYQELNDRLQELVPAIGSCDSDELDLFRLMSNLYYDLYNNSLCNADHKLPPLQKAMSQFKQQLFTEGLSEGEFELVWNCWQLLEFTDHRWLNDGSEAEDNWEGENYYPEWNPEIDWFSEKLELAFEALADAAILVAARSQGLCRNTWYQAEKYDLSDDK